MLSSTRAHHGLAPLPAGGTALSPSWGDAGFIPGQSLRRDGSHVGMGVHAFTGVTAPADRNRKEATQMRRAIRVLTGLALIGSWTVGSASGHAATAEKTIKAPSTVGSSSITY